MAKPTRADILAFMSDDEREYWERQKGTPTERAEFWANLEAEWESIPDPEPHDLKPPYMHSTAWAAYEAGSKSVIPFYTRRWKQQRRSKANPPSAHPSANTTNARSTTNTAKDSQSRQGQFAVRKLFRVQPTPKTSDASNTSNQDLRELELSSSEPPKKRRVKKLLQRVRARFWPANLKQTLEDVLPEMRESIKSSVRSPPLKARIISIDKAIHTRFATRFPKALPFTDSWFEWIFSIVTHGAFQVLSALVLVVIGLAGVNWVVLVAMGGAWLITVLWIARSGFVKSLTIGGRFLSLVFFSGLFGLAFYGLGSWGVGQYKGQKNNKPISAPADNVKDERRRTVAILPMHSLVPLPIKIAPNETLYLLNVRPDLKSGLSSKGNFTSNPIWWPTRQPELKRAGYIVEWASRCEIGNYGEAALLNVVLYYEVSFRQDGKLVARNSYQVRIAALEVGKPFVFHIVNQSPYLVQVDFPKQAEVSVVGETEKRVVAVEQAEGFDQVLQNPPNATLLPSTIKWTQIL